MVLALALLISMAGIMTVSAAETQTVNIAVDKTNVNRNGTVTVTIVVPADGPVGQDEDVSNVIGGFKGTITYDSSAFTPNTANTGVDYFINAGTGTEPVSWDDGAISFVYIGANNALAPNAYVAKVVFTVGSSAVFDEYAFGFTVEDFRSMENVPMILSGTSIASVDVDVDPVVPVISGVTNGTNYVVGTDTLPTTISWTPAGATATLNGVPISQPYTFNVPSVTTPYTLVVTGETVTTYTFTVTIPAPSGPTLTVKAGESIRIFDYENVDWDFAETVIVGFEPMINVVSELEGMFDYTGGTFKVYTIEGVEAEDEVLATGMRVSIVDENDDELVGATIIIFGDLNYDGYIENPDLFKSFDGIDPYEEPFAFIAADLNFDFYLENPDVFALFDMMNSYEFILDFPY